MSNLDLQNIEVLNYNEKEIYVDTAKDHYRFNASKDGVTPTFLPMPINDIKWISSSTSIFQIGLLTFKDEDKEEIFKELRIANWQDILTDKEIEDILLHPTQEGLEKLITIENGAYFDRVKTVCFKLVNDQKDITTRVRELIDQRAIELRRNIRKTNLVLPQIKPAATINSAELDAVKKQNEDLQAQLDEMKALMKKMAAKQVNAKKPAPKQEEDAE